MYVAFLLVLLQCQKFVEQTISPARICLYYATAADTPFLLEIHPMRDGDLGFDLS
jgi:hypothetical protein